MTVSQPVANFIQSQVSSTGHAPDSGEEFIQPIADVIQTLRNLCDELGPTERIAAKAHLSSTGGSDDLIIEMDGQSQGKANQEDLNQASTHNTNHGDQACIISDQNTSTQKETGEANSAAAHPHILGSASSISEPATRHVRSREAEDPANKTVTGTTVDTVESGPHIGAAEPIAEPRRSRRSTRTPKAAEAPASIGVQVQDLGVDSNKTRRKRKAQNLEESANEDVEKPMGAEGIDTTQRYSPKRRPAGKNKQSLGVQREDSNAAAQSKAVEQQQLSEAFGRKSEKKAIEGSSSQSFRTARVEPLVREILPLDDYIQDPAFFIIPPTRFHTRSSIPLPTSRLFVEALRKDVDSLLNSFRECWAEATRALDTVPHRQDESDLFVVNDQQRESSILLSNGPLALFSDLWTRNGWNYVHLVVGEEDVTRTAFYDVIYRVFQGEF